MSRTRLALLAMFIGGGLSVGLLMQAQHQQRAPVAFKRAFDRRCRGGCDSLSGGQRADAGPPTVLISVLAGDGGTWNMAAGTLTTADGGTVTVTRASVKFCADSSGVLHSLSSNTACVEPSGLSVEPAATNLELYDRQFTSGVNNTWVALAGGGGSVTPTDNTADVTAPDGTSTAAKFVLSAVSTPGTSYAVMASATTTAAGTFTFGCYLRVLSGTGSTYVARGDSTTDTLTLCSLTTTWTRCSVTTTNTAASHGYQIGTNLINTGQTAKPATTVYAWGCQLEAGSVLSSLIHNANAQNTRAKDFVNVGPVTLSARNIWSMSADVKLANTQASNATAILFNMYRSSTDQTRCYLSTAQKFLCAFVDSGAGAGPTTAVNVAFAANVAHHVSSTYDGSTWTTCVDTSTCTTLSTAFNVGNVSETNFGLMSDGLSGVGATGWLSHICVDNTATGCQ